MMTTEGSSNGDWETYKDRIYQLYTIEGRTLSKLTKMMTDLGFKRTKAQYERVFKKWGWKKHSKKDDWRFIAAQIKQREKQGRRSEVTIRGDVIPDWKIKKEVSRYEYLLGPYHRYDANKTTTPPHIRVYTPPLSPQLALMSLVEVYQNAQPQLSIDSFVIWAQCTPWHQFMQIIRRKSPSPSNLSSSLSYRDTQRPAMRLESEASQAVKSSGFLVGSTVSRVIELLNGPSSYDSDCGQSSLKMTTLVDDCDAVLVTGQDAWSSRSQAQSWVDTIRLSPFVVLDSYIPDVYTSPNSYLPPTLDQSEGIQLEYIRIYLKDVPSLSVLKWLFISLRTIMKHTILCQLS